MTVAGAVWGGAARSALSGLGLCLFCFGFFPLCGGVGGGFVILLFSFRLGGYGWLCFMVCLSIPSSCLYACVFSL